jgi:Predicted oxidoreductases (related to aryl-alcohol dehydrogenases)
LHACRSTLEDPPGKITKERVKNLPPDDHRRNDPHFQEPELSINLELVEKLEVIAKKYGRTPAQLAIAWILRRPEVTAAIVGIRHPSQIEEIAPAGDFELAKDDIETIDRLLQERDEKLKELGIGK